MPLRIRRRHARRHQAKSPRRPKPAWQENIESALWAVVIALAIRTFIVAPFKIPSGSMKPTLTEGDRILVNRFLHRFREPHRGEVIVFRFPANPRRPFIKRLVGLEGDRIEIRRGQVLVNGQPLTASVMEKTYYYNQGQFGQEHSVIEVPKGMYYVLGDNSASSHDSRFWGFVPKRLLIGQAMCVFWPPTRIRILR